jgi:hyperosmotically inducible periplasmic protein
MMVRLTHIVLIASLCSGAGIGTASLRAQDQQPNPADNTKTNKRDRAAAEPNADRQKENPTDRELTRKIRRALVKDKSLSTYAHNVKIITQDGNVTLKGPVRSEEEKNTVIAKATELAGEGHVIDELQVKPKNG